MGDTVRIQVDPEQKEQFILSLRIPSWSVENSLKVNGEPLDVTSGMTVIDRQWQAGDTVETAIRYACGGAETHLVPKGFPSFQNHLENLRHGTLCDGGNTGAPASCGLPPWTLDSGTG